MTSVDNETLAREQADSALSESISQEVTNRTNAVNAEQLARSNADTALATMVQTERTDRLAEVAVERGRLDAMLAGTDVDLNQLQELITAYQTSDASLLARIGTVSTNISNIQTALTTRTDRVDTLVNDSE